MGLAVKFPLLYTFRISACFSHIKMEEDVSTFIDWFTQLDGYYRRLFVESLVPRVVPDKLSSRVSIMRLSSGDITSWSCCTSFKERLSFFHFTLTGWTADKANHFVSLLEDIDTPLIYSFYDMLAGTAGSL